MAFVYTTYQQKTATLSIRLVLGELRNDGFKVLPLNGEKPELLVAIPTLKDMRDAFNSRCYERRATRHASW